MSAFGGERIVDDGLIFCIDVGDPQSNRSGSIQDLISGCQFFGFENARATTCPYPSYSMENGGIFQFSVAGNEALEATCSLSFPNDEITMELWFRIDASGDAGNNVRLFELWANLSDASTDTYDGHALLFPNDDTLTVWVNEGPNSAQTNRSTLDSDPTTGFEKVGKWIHYVMTYDGTNINLYWNVDEYQQQQAASTGIRDINRITFGNIGSFYSISDFSRNWSMGVARVYDRALSLSEIKQNYLATRGRYL